MGCGVCSIREVPIGPGCELLYLFVFCESAFSGQIQRAVLRLGLLSIFTLAVRCLYFVSVRVMSLERGRPRVQQCSIHRVTLSSRWLQAISVSWNDKVCFSGEEGFVKLLPFALLQHSSCYSEMKTLVKIVCSFCVISKHNQNYHRNGKFSIGQPFMSWLE